MLKNPQVGIRVMSIDVFLSKYLPVLTMTKVLNEKLDASPNTVVVIHDSRKPCLN